MPSTCVALTSVFCCKQRTDSVAIGAHHGVGQPSIAGCGLDDGQPACQKTPIASPTPTLFISIEWPPGASDPYQQLELQPEVYYSRRG